MTATVPRELASPFDAATIVDVLRWRAAHQPQATAFVFLQDGGDDEVQLTYAELDRRARAVGAVLQRLGFAGERALLLAPPGLDYVVAVFGCLYAGTTAVPGYPPRANRSLERLQTIAADARATCALGSGQVRDAGRALLRDAHGAAVQWLNIAEIAQLPLADGWVPPPLSGDEPAFLQYTSGSVAEPKGVVVTHGNLLHNSETIRRRFDLPSGSRGVIWLPPYHDMGLIGGIVQPVYADVPTVLMPPVVFLQRPLRWLQLVTRYRAAATGGPSLAYELCVQRSTPEQLAQLDLSSLELAFVGAEPIRAATLDRFADCFRPCGFRRQAFYPCYGLAESTLMVTGGPRTTPPVTLRLRGAALAADRVEAAGADEAGAVVLTASGAIPAEQAVAIVDPTTARRCQPGRVGEIWLAGPSVAAGYWNRPAETRATFDARIADTGEGPFLRTGDLGFVRDGQLFVTGRIKDLIIVGGLNHYPQDVERSVEASHPALRTGGCVAFSVDEQGEERLVVVAEIEKSRPGDLDGGKVREEIGRAVRRGVAEEHRLQVSALVFVKPGAIPRTSSGKVRRGATRRAWLADALPVLDCRAQQEDAGAAAEPH